VGRDYGEALVSAPAEESGLPERELPLGRSWLVACFAGFTAYACAMVFAGGNDGAWATWAVGAYAVAALAAWRLDRVGLPLLVAFGFGLVAPTAWLVLRAPATPDVVVVIQAARLLVHQGSPYLPTAQLARVTSYNPYLPAMAIFGLPRVAGFPGLAGDTRPWLVGMTLAVLGASFWLGAPLRETDQSEHRVALWCSIFALGSPVLALSLAVGITDGPIIALVCLALACIGGPRRLTTLAAVAVGVACAMKFTAWPALPVVAAMLWARDGRAVALRFVATAAGLAVVLAAAFAPGLFVHPGELIPNVVLFPLGLTAHKTPAASPVPGHLLAGLGSAGHDAAIALLVAAGVAVAASLVWKPPRDVRATTFRLAIGLVLLFGLAPSSRFGYFAYPIALVGWLALTDPAGLIRARPG
jgi:hypothetical protein